TTTSRPLVLATATRAATACCSSSAEQGSGATTDRRTGPAARAGWGSADEVQAKTQAARPARRWRAHDFMTGFLGVSLLGRRVGKMVSAFLLSSFFFLLLFLPSAPT